MATKKKTSTRTDNDEPRTRKQSDPVTKWMNGIDRMVDELTPKQLKFVVQYAASKDQNKNLAKLLSPAMLED